MTQANKQALLQLVGLGATDDLSRFEQFIGNTELAEALREKQAEERKATLVATADTVMAALRQGQTLTEAAIQKVRLARAELARAEKNLDVMLATQEAARSQDYFPLLIATNHISIFNGDEGVKRYTTWSVDQVPVLAKKAKDRHAAEKAAATKKATPVKKTTGK